MAILKVLIQRRQLTIKPFGKIFSHFLRKKVAKNLDINENSYIKDETNEYTDTVETAILYMANIYCTYCPFTVQTG